MVDINKSKYFNSLPKFIQESIMQSGVDFNSEEEIRKFVSNLENSKINLH